MGTPASSAQVDAKAPESAREKSVEALPQLTTMQNANETNHQPAPAVVDLSSDEETVKEKPGSCQVAQLNCSQTAKFVDPACAAPPPEDANVDSQSQEAPIMLDLLSPPKKKPRRG